MDIQKVKREFAGKARRNKGLVKVNWQTLYMSESVVVEYISRPKRNTRHTRKRRNITQMVKY